MEARSKEIQVEGDWDLFLISFLLKQLLMIGWQMFIDLIDDRRKQNI